jgi:adenylate cyclase, class 2
MPTEIEAKFLEVDPDEIRRRLTALGARCDYPMRLMRRDMFDYADGRSKLSGVEQLRIRDEGDKITMTYKKSSLESNYAAEIETTVGEYEAAKQVLTAIGLQVVSHQESKRETWHLDDVEVVIDEWPWLKPYIEIEGPSEQSIQAVASRLGFSWSDVKYGSVATAYRNQYPKMTKEESIVNIPEIRFDLPMPGYLEERM